MRNNDKSVAVKKISREILDIVTNLEKNEHNTYFDYDNALTLLKEVKTHILETTRCPKPEIIHIPWDERMTSMDFDPMVYEGTMGVEDFLIASENFLNEKEAMKEIINEKEKKHGKNI